MTIDMADLPVASYELHLVVNRTGFPLTFRVTPANVHEVTPAVSLFAEVVDLADQNQKAELTRGPGDSAYDSEDVYKFWADVCGGHVLCAPNRRITPDGEDNRAQGTYRKEALEY